VDEIKKTIGAFAAVVFEIACAAVLVYLIIEIDKYTPEIISKSSDSDV